MSQWPDLRCAPHDVAGLHREIERRDRIIRTLVERVERGMETYSSEYGLLQNSFTLEELVRKRTGELRHSVDDMEAFVRNAPVGILFTRDHTILRYNRKFAEIFRLDGDEAVGRSTRFLFYSDEIFNHACQVVDSVFLASRTHVQDAFLRRKDGSEAWVHSIGYSRATDEPGLFGIWMLEDLTAVKHAEEALLLSHRALEARTRELARREAELRTVIDTAYDAYVALNSEGIVTVWNLQAEENFGWRREEAVGQSLAELIVVPEMLEPFLQSLVTRDWVGQRLELPARRRDGSRLMVEVRISAMEFDGQRFFSAFLHDITERKAHEARREHEAHHDALTGLPNRRGLMEVLPAALARAQRAHAALGITYLDLDGFKAVNDVNGHAVGDRLLCEVASRLRQTVRQTDTVVRLGGDEFMILLEGLQSGREEATSYAQRLIHAIEQPMDVGEQRIAVGASIGILIHSGEDVGHSAADLIHRADTAMYEAKRAGKGRVVIVEEPLS